jgi:hypothetical protein
VQRRGVDHGIHICHASSYEMPVYDGPNHIRKLRWESVEPDNAAISLPQGPNQRFTPVTTAAGD